MLEGRNPFQAFYEAYRYQIIGKGARYYTRVTELDRGYEGHSLFLTRGGGTQGRFP